MTHVQLCQACGKMFSCETFLGYHRAVDHSPRPLTCRMCQKPYPTQKVRTSHVTAHIRNSHSCNICGEQQDTGFLLYVHLMTSHRPASLLLRCALCERDYSSRDNLKHHLESVHARRIPGLGRMAEVCCTLHSDRRFPEEDLGLDVLLNEGRNGEGDVRFEQNAITNGTEPVGEDQCFACFGQEESVPIENEVDPLWCGALSENSKLRGLASEKKSTVRKTNPLVVVQGSPSLIPPARIQLPLREPNEQDPAQNSNRTSVGHSADIPVIKIDARNDAKRLFFRDYSITSSHEQGRTVTVYTCKTCGMKSEDRIFFLLSHRPHKKQSQKIDCMVCGKVKTL